MTQRTRTFRSIAAVLLIGGSLVGTGCGSTSKDGATKRIYHETIFLAANFVDPRAGANKWFPLKPGTQWVRKGTTLIGNREVPHEVVTTVTDVIRVIQGVKTVLVYDHSVGAGQVVQESLDYFAQDKNGAVWTMGGATEQYEAGRYVAVDEAWLTGVEGARPGILMPANPTAATPAWSVANPPGGSGDAAEFVRIQKRECEPFDCFADVLVIREGKRSALDNEFKYYAAGVGQIRNQPRNESRHEDTERLINVTRLSAAGLAEASRAALRVDRRAAKELPELYRGVKASRAR